MTIVYILTGNGDSESRRYLSALYLSIATLRHFHPGVETICCTDLPMQEILASEQGGILSLIDQIICCTDLSGGPVYRSRLIKTTLRKRICGPFVYLDTDTVLIGEIGELMECRSDMGITVDQYCMDSPGMFPKWLAPHFSEIGWKYPTKKYYNAGAIFVGDTYGAHRVYDLWSSGYLISVEHGINMDQPALNAAIEETNPALVEYSEDYNFFCAQKPRIVPSSARVLHICNSLRTTTVPTYELLIEEVIAGHLPSGTEIVARLLANSNQYQSTWHALNDAARRTYELVTRHTAFRKWFDVSKK